MIYSICRATASHQIELPSVFSGEGGLRMACGGCSLQAGRDYLLHGNVVEVSSGPLLAVTSVSEADGVGYFAHVFGVSDCDGRVGGGFRVERPGKFSGSLFAVDGDRLVLGENTLMPLPNTVPSPAPSSSQSGTERENPSSTFVTDGAIAGTGAASVPTGGAGTGEKASRNVTVKSIENVSASGTKTQQSTPKVGGGGSGQAAVEAPGADKAPNDSASLSSASTNQAKTASVKPERTTKEKASVSGQVVAGERDEDIFEDLKPAWEKSQAGKDSPQGSTVDGAGEGVPVEGTSIVVNSVAADDFPVSGALPELAGVKRSELARKAEARKKGGRAVAPPVSVSPVVSSSGMRLGKESGGDNRGAVVQNKIDESELW